MKIIADLHTHTRYSHGKGTVLDNVTVALARGLKAVGITDHGPHSAPWVGATLEDLRMMRREVAEIDRRAVAIRVLAGVECNIISADGDLDVPEALRQKLDIVLAGLHPGVLPKTGRDWFSLSAENWAARFSGSWRRRARRDNTRALVEAVLRHEIDVITHPGYHLDIDTVELANACAAKGTALEINASHNAMTVQFCRIAAQQGVRLVINSDAHDPSAVGNLTRGLAVARAAGLRPEQILNSDRGGLFDWLEERKARRAGPPSDWADWAEQPGLNRLQGPPEPGGPAGRETGQSPWLDWSKQGKLH